MGGCPVEDIAPDVALNEFVARYRAARMLYDANQISEILIHELRELGLMEDFDFFLKLECVYAEWKSVKNKKPEPVHQWKRH